MLEMYVYAENNVTALTTEIKKLSKYYFKEEVDLPYITYTGQKINFITKEGRLYLKCENYSEIFGYSRENTALKINNLNIYNLRDREVIFGLFKLYDTLIEGYMKKYNINPDEKNLKTEILEEIILKNNLSDKDLEILKNAKVLKDVDYTKIKLNELKEQLETGLKLEEEKKPKFFI